MVRECGIRPRTDKKFTTTTPSLNSQMSDRGEEGVRVSLKGGVGRGCGEERGHGIKTHQSKLSLNALLVLYRDEKWAEEDEEVDVSL